MLSGKTRNHSGAMLAKGSLAALLLACASPVHAETLKEALTAAYLYNPTLKAAQAQLRSTDNSVSLAKSGYRPFISSTFQYGFEDFRATTRSVALGPGSVPICPGAVNANGKCALAPGESAGSRSLNSFGAGGTQGIRATPGTAEINAQQNVFDGFQTYNNVKVLAEQLRATEDRFKVGEVTKTDLSQAQASLAQGRADLSIVQGTLYGDQALFARFIGHPPRALKDPGPPERLLPKTLDAAIAIARAENPGILGAIFQERAQQHLVEQLKGQLLPSLTAVRTASLLPLTSLKMPTVLFSCPKAGRPT